MKPNARVIEVVAEALQHRGFSSGEANQIVKRLLKYGEEATMVELPKIPFGKYKGISIDRVPREYLDWLTSQTWFREKYDALYQDILGAK